MSNLPPDPRLDRLYRLLPAVHRRHDAERTYPLPDTIALTSPGSAKAEKDEAARQLQTVQKYPLQALLRVIAEQVNVVEDDIAQLYENWFIETCADWVVPYLGDLIGYRPVSEADATGEVATAEGRALNRVLIPRREVANTIAYRRRKGTLALLELLANDVADWPARAVEFFKLLDWTQNLNHLHLDRAHTVDLRAVQALDLLDGPFDPLAHTVDVRRINSHHTLGRYNLPSIGVFVWRLKRYRVTHTRAHCQERVGPHCYTFSVLGQDLPLWINPEPETDPTHIAEELNLPAPIRRRAFARHPGRYYGTGKSFAIWVNGWAGCEPTQPVPLEAIVAADLSDWQYAPPPNQIAVDPVLGRFAFSPEQEHLPKKGVHVTYHYAFSADLGGGEYERTLYDPSPRPPPPAKLPDGSQPPPPGIEYYRVGKGQPFHHLREALLKWNEQKPLDAVIELTDSAVHVEPVHFRLEPDQTLQLRAAKGVRPVLRLLDWQTDLPDALDVTMSPGSRFTLDGLLITGRGVRLHGPRRAKPGDARAPICGAQVVLRHCTLVPGWSLDHRCEPERSEEPSLELHHVRAAVRLEHCILGSIQIHEDEVRDDPIPVCIADSILDATRRDREALGAPGYAVAHAVLTIRRCTVFGIVDVHAVKLAENCIFNDCVNVARRQLGCMRFCYVPYGCRTPRRYHCQPDLAAQAIQTKMIADATPIQPTQEALETAKELERLRVRPQFNSVRYGTPTYCQLADFCADEIRRGADDESEMGVFHDLFQPQREANLRARLDEYTPAGMDAGLIYAS